MKRVNKKFALKWHKVPLKLHSGIRYADWTKHLMFNTEMVRHILGNFPFDSRYLDVDHDFSHNHYCATVYIEDEAAAIAFALMYG